MTLDRILLPAIDYFFVIPEDDPYHASPLQGFSFGITEARSSIRHLISLPADVVEPALPEAARAGRRANGVGAWHWHPLALYALKHLEVLPERPFWVMLTHDAKTASAVDRWIAKQTYRPFHISQVPGAGRLSIEQVNHSQLLTHFRQIFSLVSTREADLERRLVSEALDNWKPRPSLEFHRAVPGHNVIIPNVMALEGLGYRFEEWDEQFLNDPADYVREIAAIANAVLDLRERTSATPAFRTTPPQPDLYLTAPSLYMHVYEEGIALPRDLASKPARDLLQMLRRQTGYQLKGNGRAWADVMQDPVAMVLLNLRQRELSLQVATAGLAAASNLAATIRLPGAVNRAQGTVRQMAAHARSGKARSARKLASTFAEVQARLAKAVGPDLLSVIARSRTGVKLVADVPLEWLPIGDLPLMLRKDVSRITTTPGNLQTGMLARSELIHLDARAFQEILVVSAIDQDDPIADVLLDMMADWAPMYEGKVTLRIVKIATREELVAALNAFHGAVMIFDGHGGHDQTAGVATLRIGTIDVSIWDLRSQIRVPPVVILSACDTQAADRSHATTANAFLNAGAITVLGSLLPIDARDSAMFIARFIWRLAEFLPSITGKHGRAVLWSEVMAGMLRLHLVFDLLRPLVQQGLINFAQYEEVNMAAILATTNQEEEWWSEALRRAGEFLGMDEADTMDLGKRTIAASDAIRYVQIGNPELIVIKSRALLREVGYDV